MRKHILKCSIFLLIVNSSALFAGDDYKCVIERLYFAREIEGDLKSSYETHYLGKEFAVERRSGVTSGALKNSFVNTPIVVDYGSPENGYKVVNYMKLEEGAGAGTNIYALNILEYKEGPKKPFVFLINSEVFFGTCVHF